jgi:ATP-dependent Lon protease
MYPNGEVTDEQLEELLLVAVEGRQRVRNQLHLMAPGEYGPVTISARLLPSGKVITPTLAEAGRRQRVVLPTRPLVGEVTGLAVAGEQGLILRFEMQVSKGHGRIVPLGSIQRVMRESIEAAAQYVLSHASELGIPPDWRENFDVAVLATQMGIPKEGPSAGITIVTGIVSALKNIPVRHDIAMTGEITIMGKVLAVGGIQGKLLAAIEAGVKTVILPADNEQDVRFLPQYMRDRVELVYARDIQEALTAALALPPARS